MKIKTLIVLLLASGITAAQDTTATKAAETKTVTETRSVIISNDPAKPILLSKKGERILPEKGDFAIGIDARPFLFYFGNIFNSTADNAAPDFVSVYPASVYGKYFLSDRKAVRANISFGVSTRSNTNYVIQDNVVPDPNVTVKDSRKATQSDILIASGTERRRGAGRLQGVYGLQGVMTFSSSREVFVYGNPMSATFNSPNSTDFTTGGAAPLASRIVERKNGTTIGLYVKGFVGVEYFVLPKLSIGGEIGAALGLQTTGDGAQVNERWDTGNSDIKRETTHIGGQKRFGFDVGLPSQLGLNTGALTITFHF